MGKTSTSSRPWPVRKEHSDHMAMRQKQNAARIVLAEDWMAARLAKTPWKWTRQARWGFRIYDFWCHQLGIAIEVDGPEHVERGDADRDWLDWQRSGIVVVRVKNFNKRDAVDAIAAIQEIPTWNARRATLGKAYIRGVQ